MLRVPIAMAIQRFTPRPFSVETEMVKTAPRAWGIDQKEEPSRGNSYRCCFPELGDEELSRFYRYLDNIGNLDLDLKDIRQIASGDLTAAFESSGQG